MIPSKTSSNTKVIAHRGAWKNTGAPENSIEALKHAIAMGCAGCEFDVHLSLDDVLFVYHDEEIERLWIEKTTSAELRKIKLSNGEPLPLLEEYLREGLKQQETRLILEIKPSIINNQRSIKAALKVLELVQTLKAEAITDYICFDYLACLEIKKKAPYAHVAYLNGDKDPLELAAAQLDGLDYEFEVLQQNPDWITIARAENLSINSWTVDDEKVMDWLIAENIDFITTNEPEKLLQKLKHKDH